MTLIGILRSISTRALVSSTRRNVNALGSGARTHAARTGRASVTFQMLAALRVFGGREAGSVSPMDMKLGGLTRAERRGQGREQESSMYALTHARQAAGIDGGILAAVEED